MSVCGSCVLYDNYAQENYGVSCEGDCRDSEECQEKLFCCIDSLEKKLEPFITAKKPHKKEVNLSERL